MLACCWTCGLGFGDRHEWEAFRVLVRVLRAVEEWREELKYGARRKDVEGLGRGGRRKVRTVLAEIRQMQVVRTAIEMQSPLEFMLDSVDDLMQACMHEVRVHELNSARWYSVPPQNKKINIQLASGP